MKLTGNPWLKTLWKILTNPAVDVIAAIVVVIVATWFVVSTEALQRVPPGHVPFMHK